MDRVFDKASELWHEMGFDVKDPAFFQYLEGFRGGHRAGERAVMDALTTWDIDLRNAELARYNASLTLRRNDFRLALVPVQKDQHLQPPAPEPGLEEPEDARDAGAVDQGV